jgi:hypothetical protein
MGGMLCTAQYIVVFVGLGIVSIQETLTQVGVLFEHLQTHLEIGRLMKKGPVVLEVKQVRSLNPVKDIIHTLGVALVAGVFQVELHKGVQFFHAGAVGFGGVVVDADPFGEEGGVLTAG